MSDNNSFFLKVGDTADPLEAVLTDANGPVDLSAAASVHFKMRESRLLTTKVDSLAVPDPDQINNKGKVRYFWQDSDVNTDGGFLGEFRVVGLNGKKATFPNGENYISIDIGFGVRDKP